MAKVINDNKASAQCSYVLVAKSFLGNFRAANYEELGQNTLTKRHFFYSHLLRFPDNLGDFSEGQWERFHQDIKVMEERCIKADRTGT